MPVTIRFAETTDNLEALYRARHWVLVDIDNERPPSPDGRLVDRFDTIPATSHILAMHNGHIVGGIRLTRAPMSRPSWNGWRDVRLSRTSTVAAPVAASMFFLEPLYRGTGVAREMLALGHTWLQSIGSTHVVAAVPTVAISAFRHAGYVRSERFHRSPHHGSGLILFHRDLLPINESQLRLQQPACFSVDLEHETA